MRRPRHRWLVLGLAVVLAGVVTLVSLTTILHPRLDTPERADAIVVLGGRGDRMAVGLRLLAEGVAPVVVASDATGADPRCRLAAKDPRILCYRPDPYTTQGEARGFAEMAREHGWRSVVVVASTDQASRARIRFARCFSGPTAVTAAPEPADQARFAFFYEWGALLKAETLQRSC